MAQPASLTDYEHALFTRLLALMNSPFPDECTLAAQAAFSMYTGSNALLVGEAIKGLLSQRRALQTVCTTFLGALPNNRAGLQPTTRAILAALAEDPLTISLRAELIIEGLPWDGEMTQELVKLAPLLHADALASVQQAIQGAFFCPANQLFDLETTLAASADERLRRLALAALIAQSQQASGWSDEACVRLESYRSDPSPLVAEAAQFTFVA
jgi:hypothetical protein